MCFLLVLFDNSFEFTNVVFIKLIRRKRPLICHREREREREKERDEREREREREREKEREGESLNLNPEFACL